MRARRKRIEKYFQLPRQTPAPEIDKTTRLSNPTSFHQQCNIIHLFITEILNHCKLGNILSYTILFLLPNWNSIPQNSNATTKMSEHADPKSINKNTHTHSQTNSSQIPLDI